MVEAVPVEIQPHQLRHKVWPATYWVDSDEPALLIVERNEMAPDNRMWRRYQTVFVIRGDGLAKYMEDMGPADLYLASELSVPGGDPSLETIDPKEWHTVAELKDYADDFREVLTHRAIRRTVPDLIGGYHDQLDQEQRARKHVSQFGKHHRIARI